MSTQDKPSQTSTDAYVQPLVKRAHLNGYWIGLAAALEWIALRGQPISLESYLDREDAADEMLVSTLADQPPAIAESVVRGAEAGAADILVPVSSGIWRQTATSDAKDADLSYRLIGTDDHDEWEGAIIRTSQQALQVGECPGYERMQIQSAFILEKWPEHTLDIEPVPVGPAAASPAVERVIAKAIVMADDEMAPISQREMLVLVKRCLPNARRDQVREIYRELVPTSKPGPKGRREHDRDRLIGELGDKLAAAQLHN